MSEKKHFDREIHREELHRDLGPKNQYDKLAAQSYLLGVQFKNTKLESDGQRLAELIQQYPYHSDHFYRVIALGRDVERQIRVLTVDDAHVCESISIEDGKNKNPWTCTLERQADGWRISFGKWNATPDETLSPSVALAQQLITRVLHEAVRADTLHFSTEEQDFGFCRYENTYAQDHQGRTRIWYQYHQHGSGDVGTRKLYSFPDTKKTDPFSLLNVEQLWKEIQNIIASVEIKTADDQLPPDTWAYPEKGQFIRLPKGVSRVDSSTLHPETNLYRIPGDLIHLYEDPQEKDRDYESLRDIFDCEPSVYAVSRKDDSVAVLIITDGQTRGFDELHTALERQWETSEATTKKHEGIPWNIPVIYDPDSHWLLFPLGVDVQKKLARESRSDGPSGTHFLVTEGNRFMHKLCQGKKEADFSSYDRVPRVQYLNISRAADGRLYLDVSVQHIGRDIALALESVGVATMDQMPIFQGKGSLQEALSAKTDAKISALLLQAFKETIILPSGSIRCEFSECLRRRAELESGFDIAQYLARLAGEYGQNGGIPAAAILVSRASGSQQKIEVMISGDHPDAEKRLVSKDGSDIRIRLDGVLRLRPRANADTIMPNFDFQVVHITDQQGRPLSPEASLLAQALLQTVALESAQQVALSRISSMALLMPSERFG